jgi:hypothetical protein
MAGAALALAVAAVGCGESPTSPTPIGGGGGSRTVTGLTIGGSVTVSQGGTSQLTATAQYSDQTSDTVTSQATWTSSNPAVATVSATGLLTAVGTGSADVTATFQSATGRRTVQISAARFDLRVELSGLTAIDTCDDFTQGLTEGEFAYLVTATTPDGATTTLSSTTNYPGNANQVYEVKLARNETRSLSAARTFNLTAEAGQFVRMTFRATEWDDQIVLIPPSVRFVPDDNMNDRSITRTHAYGNGTWSNLGANSLTLGSGSCSVRLNYTVTATRQ